LPSTDTSRTIAEIKDKLMIALLINLDAIAKAPESALAISINLSASEDIMKPKIP